MDRVSLRHYTWAGILFSAAAGVLLHFLYEWTGRNPVIGAFCPVNESVWEHLKLLFFPCLVFFLWERRRTGQAAPGLLNARIRGLLLGLLVIVCGYYTYEGILGRDLPPVDILLFAASVLTVYLSCRPERPFHPGPSRASVPLLLILLLLFGAFLLFTYLPLHIPLFMDPETFTFGIPSGLQTF